MLAPGDEVMAGDVIFEMETDKATMEVECPEDGVLARILVCCALCVSCRQPTLLGGGDTRLRACYNGAFSLQDPHPPTTCVQNVCLSTTCHGMVAGSVKERAIHAYAPPDALT